MPDTTIYQHLNRIQQQISVPKNQRNAFGNYNYRSCEDIVEAAKPLLQETNLTLSDEPIVIGDWHYIKATATLSLGKESISVTAYAREAQTKKGMDESQITGTASSYARKYALNGLFAIDDTKDADTMDNTAAAGKRAPSEPARPVAPPKINKAQLDAIYAFIDEGVIPEAAREQAGTLTSEKAQAWIIKANRQKEEIADKYNTDKIAAEAMAALG